MHRNYVKMNFEYFLRLCVRKHGKDYVSAIMMLSDMKKHDRLPKEMHIVVEAELMQVARYVGSFLKLEDNKDDDSDASTTAATIDISCMPCGEEYGLNTVAVNDCNCGPDDPREDEDDYFQEKWGEGLSEEILEAAASAMGASSVTITPEGTSDSLLLADAMKKAKELSARRAKEGVADTDGSRKFSAAIAAKAAELARIVSPVGDPGFPELFQLSYQWIYDSGASRHVSPLGQENQRRDD